MTDNATRHAGTAIPAIDVLQARVDELYREADCLEDGAPDGVRPACARALYRQADLLVQAIDVLRAAGEPALDPDFERASRISDLRDELVAHRRRGQNLSRQLLEANELADQCERELERELEAERQAAPGQATR